VCGGDIFQIHIHNGDAERRQGGIFAGHEAFNQAEGRAVVLVEWRAKDK